MQPTVDEILEGVENSFRRDLFPEIESEWGKRISAALLDAVGHVRLRLRLGRGLAEEEYADLAALLARLGQPASNAAAPGEGTSIEALEQAVFALRATLDGIIRAHPNPQAGDAGWDEIMAYLGRQLDREAQLIPQ